MIYWKMVTSKNGAMDGKRMERDLLFTFVLSIFLSYFIIYFIKNKLIDKKESNRKIVN